MERENYDNRHDELTEEDYEKIRHKHDTAEQSRDCDHDMEYSTTIGVIGGICKKCGYRTC